MLGRPYQVSGRVGEGERRGRQIGVPTINLADMPPQKLLPPDGVYAVRVEWRGGRAGGMMNQGPSRPSATAGGRWRRTCSASRATCTASGSGSSGWSGSATSERFPSVEALKQQLERDRTRALAVLAAARPDPAGDLTPER